MTPQELKNSILQRAIEGKLVEQRKEEGTGEELYKLIQEEKNKLIKEGKVKKQKPLPEITEEEIPFDIPESWKWVKLGNISNITAGGTPNRTNTEYWGGNIPWVKIGDMKGKYITETSESITKKGLENSSAKIFSKGTILYSIFASIGTVGILKIDASTNQAIAGLKFYGDINLDYIYYILLRLKFILLSKARGMAQLNINQVILKNTPIPLPPLAGQKRIVEKIEALMPLVEAYEKNWQRLEDLNKKFPEDLKKSLLQEAIKGRLVEQRKEEGTGEELFELIKEEKDKFIKEGKIKKQKPLPEITEEEIPFDIPESWKWVRLGEITLKLTDGAHKTPTYTNEGIPFLSVKDISSGKIDYSSCRFISKKEHDKLFERCNPERGDLLLTKVGTTGIPVVIDTDEEFSLFVSVALLKFPKKLINIYFLKHLINSPLVQVQVKENTRGVGNKNWVMRDIANTIIPLPPLAEQKRIVEKLEELLPLCEQVIKN